MTKTKLMFSDHEIIVLPPAQVSLLEKVIYPALKKAQLPAVDYLKVIDGSTGGRSFSPSRSFTRGPDLNQAKVWWKTTGGWKAEDHGVAFLLLDKINQELLGEWTQIRDAEFLKVMGRPIAIQDFTPNGQDFTLQFCAEVQNQITDCRNHCALLAMLQDSHEQMAIRSKAVKESVAIQARRLELEEGARKAVAQLPFLLASLEMKREP